MQRADSLEKTTMLGKIEGRSKGNNREWDGLMASLTHEHEFKQSPGGGKGQESLARHSPCSCQESDTTEWLNNKFAEKSYNLLFSWEY